MGTLGAPSVLRSAACLPSSHRRAVRDHRGRRPCGRHRGGRRPAHVHRGRPALRRDLPARQPPAARRRHRARALAEPHRGRPLDLAGHDPAARAERAGRRQRHPRPAPLHLLRVVERAADTITLAARSPPQPGWPVPLATAVRYAVGGRRAHRHPHRAQRRVGRRALRRRRPPLRAGRATPPPTTACSAGRGHVAPAAGWPAHRPGPAGPRPRLPRRPPAARD